MHRLSYNYRHWFLSNCREWDVPFYLFQNQFVHHLWFKSRASFFRKFLWHWLLKKRSQLTSAAFADCSAFLCNTVCVLVHCNDYVTYLLNKLFCTFCIFATVVDSSFCGRIKVSIKWEVYFSLSWECKSHILSYIPFSKKNLCALINVSIINVIE